MTNSILKNLNHEQLQGVKHTQGPLLISAGAGSGKTRVLTHRIAYMIANKNIQPYQILALTFTDNAANEMKGRIIKLCGNIGKQVWASTFHSFGTSILRHYADKLGYSRKFSIAGPSAQISLTRKILKHLNVDTQTYKPRMVHDAISAFKNTLKTPSEIVNDAKFRPTKYKTILAKTYADYQHVLHHDECLDFDDLLMMPVLLFTYYPRILAHYQNIYRYISVDEYQDTNEAQYEMIALLADKYHNICVVGDADQSIYGWRGANPQNIVRFKNDNPYAKVIRMNHNYRSTGNILKAANSVIKYNHDNDGIKDKNLWTQRGSGPKCVLFQAQDDQQEAEYIAQTISKEVKNHQLDYRDCAILYRTNAQSRALEDTMLKYQLPYKIIGNINFYDRLEIKAELNYLQVISNPKNEFALRQIIDFPRRGIGRKTIIMLTNFANEQKVNMFDAMHMITPDNSGMGAPACQRLNDLYDTLHYLNLQIPKKTVTGIAKLTLNQSGYMTILKKQSRTYRRAEDRIENLKEFMSVTRKFDKENDRKKGLLANFLSQIMLELNQNPNKTQSKNTVKLMTIHASKGQEYKHVFITGLEENIFPTYRSIMNPDIMPEERRLMYVAITRAKNELTMTNAKRRLLWGHVQGNMESRFINEADPRSFKFIVGPKVTYHKHPSKVDNQIFKHIF